MEFIINKTSQYHDSDITDEYPKAYMNNGLCKIKIDSLEELLKEFDGESIILSKIGNQLKIEIYDDYRE